MFHEGRARIVAFEIGDVFGFSVRDRVFVQRLLKKVLRGLERLDVSLDALVAGIGFEDRRAGKSKELRPGEELFDCSVVLALDENSKRNKGREKKGLSTYTDLLEPLREKRIVFIFDECHRSQFGESVLMRNWLTTSKVFLHQS